jgi:hypothetical protein
MPKNKMNCLKCNTEFKAKHKYHVFCSYLCKIRNYKSENRIHTEKLFAEVKVKPKSKFFDWADYPEGV